MRKKRLLLATAALTTMTMACGDKHKKPIIYANTKHPTYPVDAGTPEPDAPPPPSDQTG